MTAATTAIPFRFLDLHVLRTARLAPSFMRITLGGTDLARASCGGRDQRVKLFFPHPHQEAPVLPPDRDGDWFGQWRAMDPRVRAVMRTYTVREHRKDTNELDIDFALHEPGGGPASRWAAEATEGSPVVLLGPVVADNGGVDFRPPPHTDWVLLTADETGLPAVESILSWLPATMRVRVWIEVACAQDIRGLPMAAQAEITWLIRDNKPAGDGATGAGAHAAEAAVRAAELPSGSPYAWIAGEASEVRSLRRHLVNERGFDRGAVVFTGYWRRGAGEDDLLAEYVSNSSDQG
ncbi:MAG TPA: siderophore-interacting protein [Pseudonocardiaceae bacterium]|nr:siderophore-interacting protein [Pseudonocardiaceae bacterium]